MWCSEWNMKDIVGSSGVKLATGGIGGDQSHGNNLMPKAVQCSAIDLLSIHGYVGTANFWTATLPGWASTAEGANKLLYVEEFGVATSDSDNFDAQTAAVNSARVPWVYWEITPGPDGTQTADCWTGCCTGYDSFEVGFNSSKVNVKSSLGNAAKASAAQDWSFA